MTDVIFISAEVAMAIHDEQIHDHGGIAGLRDEGLLASAMARAEMKAHYGESNIAALAASYAYAIARNHPFLDGNKRTAFVAMQVFLRLNGRMTDLDEADAIITFLKLAAGEIAEEELAAWIQMHSRDIKSSPS
jgi:death on curing protein